MKMVMIVYNEAMDMEVMETLEDCCLENYTKINGIHGRGKTSGTHLGNDVWPGRNNILYVACEEDKAQKLWSLVKKLREQLGKEGVKAFIWPLEELT